MSSLSTLSKVRSLKKLREQRQPKTISKNFEPLSLSEFIKTFWHVVEPGRSYIHNWHIDAISDHLTAVTHKKIQNLIISVPPGHMKSLSVAVFWVAWEWAEVDPTSRWIFSSYSQSLSKRDSVKCRRLIQSPDYQARYRDRFQLSSDQNEKMRFENDRTGFRMASSTGGVGTGARADRIVTDDPMRASEAESDTVRQSVIEWWDEEMSTRGSDPATSAKVIIMQRLHDSDLTGHVLRQGGYELLCLPAEFEIDRKCITSIGWEDPRKEDGELLFPDRFGRKELDELKLRLGSFAYAAQMQQRPTPREGGIIQTDWLKYYRIRPHFPKTIQVWDTASKAGETNAFWVCGTWGIHEGGYYLLDVFRKRMEYPEGKRMAFNLALRDRPDAIVIEDKSSGTHLIQEFNQGISTEGQKIWFNVIPVKPESDKITRMAVEAPAIESGRVYLPENAEWLAEFISEITTFPFASTADQVDMLSMFLRWAKENPLTVKTEFETGEERGAYQALSGW